MQRWFAILAVMLVCGAAVAGDEQKADPYKPPKILIDEKTGVTWIKCSPIQFRAGKPETVRLTIGGAPYSKSLKAGTWAAHLGIAITRPKGMPRVLKAEDGERIKLKARLGRLFANHRTTDTVTFVTDDEPEYFDDKDDTEFITFSLTLADMLALSEGPVVLTLNGIIFDLPDTLKHAFRVAVLKALEMIDGDE